MRITGGQYRSRALTAPKGSLTRPTSDRVREALFSILGPRAAAERVLDLYAGTGALGLEALSRGAKSVVFVERSKEALASLHSNVEALGVAGSVRVVASSVERAAARLRGEREEQRYGLIFADPPYADVSSGRAKVALETLFVRLLKTGGMLVLEHASRDPPPAILGLMQEDTRTYGDTTLTFYEGTQA